MHVLMISPVPSHPQHQGNSARIFEMGRALQMLGATLHFVYINFEGCDVDTRSSMEVCWDQFDVIDVTVSLRSSMAEHYLLEDWYEPQLDIFLKKIFALYDFDVVLTTYVWMSRSFLQAPAKTFKVLDAQDVFGDRHKRLLAHSVAPAWYYTSPKEEARGLARADCILAIQEEEAEVFRARGATNVEVLGHLLPARFLSPRQPEGRVRIGYIGSSNPTNVDSMKRFCSVIHQRRILMDRFTFLIAGPICDIDFDDHGSLTRLGRVESVGDFYRDMDIIINPNVGGSGLKIKSVEALSFGRPIIATVEAMLGIDTEAREHCCRDAEDMCDILEHFSDLEGHAASTRAVFQAYQKRQYDSLERVFGLYCSRHSELARAGAGMR